VGERKPSKRALQLAFYTGVLTISDGNGNAQDLRLMARISAGNARSPPSRRKRPPICSTARCARRGS